MKKNLLIFSFCIVLTGFFLSCSSDDDTVELAGVSLSKTSVILKPEVTEQLEVTFYPEDATNKSVVWSSSDTSVATVDDTGLITAVGTGDATITVTSTETSSLNAVCDVTVSWETLNNVSGEVSGVWAKNSTINVTGHITVPEGETLTIEEGVQVIFDDNGVGTSHTKIEFMVAGNLYCEGTEDNPILLSAASGKRTEANTFGGLWGGIVATGTCGEMVFNYVTIEYTGGDVVSDSPSALAGIYTPGDDITPHITTSNPNGKYVITNCILRNGRSDAIYFMGGSAIIANNTFSAIGETGAEAINMKAGVKVDAAYNLIFAPNTNGFKLSSSGQDNTAGRGQALIRAYNNTIINAGWRRDGVKGGGCYVEKGALVSVFNNLYVNCKFMALTPKLDSPGPDAGGADNSSVIDYNFYTSGSQESTLIQDDPDTKTAYLGYTSDNSGYYHDGRNGTPIIDEHSIVSASAGDVNTNPAFVNYGLNTVALNSYEYDDSWDFHVASSSPVLTGAYADFTGAYAPYWETTGLTVNGTEYTTPAPTAYFGVFGAE